MGVTMLPPASAGIRCEDGAATLERNRSLEKESLEYNSQMLYGTPFAAGISGEVGGLERDRAQVAWNLPTFTPQPGSDNPFVDSLER